MTQAGRCLMVGLPGTDLDPATERRLSRLGPAGLILFRRNLAEARQVRALLDRFVELVGGPALLAVDQEGGRVSRLEPWVGPTPSAARLAGGGEAAVADFARTTGRALRSLGFNLDFAPVVDLSPPDADNGIADRAFGTDALRVTRLARCFLEGLHEGGVAGCLKHFPGLGDTAVDSHVELPVVTRDRGRLEREDLHPYRELGALAPAVMVGHAHYPALDPGERRPASCSPPVVSGLLRGELGYRGLVVSDDLEMGAVGARDADGAAAVEALAAGCDLLLYCSELDRAEAARAALERARGASPALEARLDRAVERIRRTARRWSSAPGRPESWLVAARAFERFRAWTG